MARRSLSARTSSHASRREERLLKLWLALLCFAELADLVTTHADRIRGGIEVNQVSAFTLDVGGSGLYWTLKLGLVLVMGAVVMLALRFARNFPDRRARVVKAWVARSIQLSVLVLTVSSIGNVVVLMTLGRGDLGL
jgi:hypothetical protein